MTPQELAAAERQAQIIGQSAANEMKQIAMSVHADVMGKVFAELLGKWMDQHRAFGHLVPTANDLRWLARIAPPLFLVRPRSDGNVQAGRQSFGVTGWA